MNQFADQFIIRKAKSEDAEAIIEYIKQVADETPFLSFSSDEWRLSTEEEAKHISERQQSDNEIILLGVIGDEIISHLFVASSYKRRMRHVGEFGITVKKKYWRKGVGKAMMNRMMNWADQNKILKKLTLKVSEKNKKAMQIYQSYGFTFEGQLKNDFLVDGQYEDTIIMSLWIG